MEIPVAVSIGPIHDGDERAQAPDLVSRLISAQNLHAQTGKEIADLKEQLAKLPAARYPGRYAGQAVSVVAETTAFKPNDAQIEAARKISGPHADVLFKRVESVVYKPVEGIRDIARVLMTPRRFAQLVALCEVPVKAHVRG